MQFKNYILIGLFILVSQSLVAQVGTLSGAVTEKDGTNPLIGANVYFHGTTIGAATNSDGIIRFET
ncbi:carboxypeptidase-like regulatory domain-containing protein [Labilibaculum manganireducens]|uniref:carboxypeptidase-like regulatory domain-containing protein n=1 Tax=Labilibaculum manganireducens TaxID=1940525 RepID=UPI0029F470AB|nr:carboxypeptidase-like regulatory domain-containing protein [Labilibaculum manganireducens]